ncbi:MAG: exosortase-associated EpsI family protein [Pedosphaera sp.]|nr:exosortase-associated EpsI family protein [Pedosphaera sp.]
MNKQKIILMLVSLALIGGGAGVLVQLKAKQKLGDPGVKCDAIPDGKNLHVRLPELVLRYQSEEIPQEAIVTNTLPRDTSYGQRHYFRKDEPNDWLRMSVVLMGTDRTSMHKPQYCLEGAGWKIDNAASSETKIPIARPQPYDLPVIKLLATRTFQNTNGATITYRGIYIYWFVADGALSGDKSGGERMWWMAKNLLQTGVLQRWAYVSCFSICLPGQEEATFERMKTFLGAAVPGFQLTPKPPASPLSVNP